MMGERQTIPARGGRAVRLGAGESLRLINTHGTQVVDTWAFNADDMAECMSMEHSRVAIGGVFPRPGDTMVTNKRRPILTLVEDTSPGIHDTLIAACDRWRYILLGAGDDHDNCEDNLHNALAALDLEAPKTPSPWNMVDEHPRGRGRLGLLRAGGGKPRRLRGAAGGDGSGRGLLMLPARHPSHQRRRP